MDEHIAIHELCEIRQHIAKLTTPVVLVVEKDAVNFCGKVIDDVFGYRIGEQQTNIGKVLRDFRQYESSQGRTPLVFTLQGAVVPTVIDGYESQSEWVVHATNMEAGTSIIAMRRLCSWEYLKAAGIPFRSFGRQILGEPSDYYNLIHFAPIDCPWAEDVVASKQHESFCSHLDTYIPGMRFYFRVPSLISQPNYVAFMGGHAIRGFVDLDAVAHCVVTSAELDGNTAWTPETFTQAADDRFRKKAAPNA